MAVTIKDVAKKAGVSISTVSKCINGGNVLEPKRTEILKAIEELNFRVNPLARGMKTKKTSTVGVLVPNISDYFGRTILSYASRYLYGANYSTVFCDYVIFDDSKTNVSEKIKFLLKYSVDGVIVQPVDIRPEELDLFRKENVPVVFVDLKDDSHFYDSVTLNNEKAVYDVISKLTAVGHKRIAFVSGRPGISTTDERVTGYMRALRDAGLPVIPEYVFRKTIDSDSGYEAMEHFMSLKEKPSAVFIGGHDLVTGALSYCSEHKVSIPDDISFVGFENEEASKIYRPTLSYATQPMKKMAEGACQMLIDRINGSYVGAARCSVMNADFVEGLSVKNMN